MADANSPHGRDHAAHLHACDACRVGHSSWCTGQSAPERPGARHDGLLGQAVHRQHQDRSVRGAVAGREQILGAAPELLPVRVDRIGTGDTNFNGLYATTLTSQDLSESVAINSSPRVYLYDPVTDR